MRAASQGLRLIAWTVGGVAPREKRVKQQALRIVRAAETQALIVEPGQPFPLEMCSK